MLAVLRTIPGLKIKSDTELAASMDMMLSMSPESKDVWIFAYGSLMWNPAFDFEQSCSGVIYGWHRKFCIQTTFGRGTPENPALFLALDPGGAAKGIMFKLPAGREREELALVWQREMFSDAHVARWVSVSVESGVISAITFVANRTTDTYRGSLDDVQIAKTISTASGSLGTNLEYLEEALRHLHELGQREPGLERILRLCRS